MKLFGSIRQHKIAAAFLSAVLVVPLFVSAIRRRHPPGKGKPHLYREHPIGTAKRLTICLAVAGIGVATFGVISFFLGQYAMDPEGNLLGTGELRVNLNDGKPLIREEDVIGPGMEIEKHFFIENLGNYDAWYQLYFENVQGDMADAVEVCVREGERILLQGRLSDLTAEKVSAIDDLLLPGERRTLTAAFRISEKYGNEIQKQSIRFQLGARAVQAKNNPAKDFGD